MDKQDISNFCIGLGTGLILGGVVGLLVAPKSGKEVRGIIKDRISKIKPQIKKGWKNRT